MADLYRRGHMWGDIMAVDEWLDADASRLYQDQPLAQDWGRLAKMAEELGEAIEAIPNGDLTNHDLARLNAISVAIGKAVNGLIGTTGQNPRKGVFRSHSEMLKEVADVVWTGIFCLQHFTKDAYVTEEILADKLASIVARIPREQ